MYVHVGYFARCTELEACVRLLPIRKDVVTGRRPHGHTDAFYIIFNSILFHKRHIFQIFILI